MIKALIFDWGDTLMRDFPEYSGSMAFWPKVELMPYVDIALKAIGNKYECYAASNAGASDLVLMGKAFERAGINDYFKNKFTSKELGFKKPELQFYSEIVRRTGFKPDEHVMIGNDYFKDIKPAKEIGMKTILVSNELTGDTSDASDFIIGNMAELESVLKVLEGM